MKIEFYKKNGEKDAPQEYPKNLESEVSDARILEYVRMIRANMRKSTADTKDKSEVSGGGKKPWRQKGTGRARVGSSRSPIWIGGGITFGPTIDRNFKIRLNKKEKRAALLAAIYTKVKEKKAIGMSDLALSGPKTKEAATALEKLPIAGKVIVFAPAGDTSFEKSFRNIPIVTLALANNIDVISIISSDSIVFTKESLAELSRHFSNKKEKVEPSHESTPQIITDKSNKNEVVSE